MGQSGVDGLASSAAYTFGQAMSFYLRGETAVSVQTAALIFKADEWEQPLFVTIPVDFSSEIDLVWEVAFNEAPVAPFSSVTYYWELLMEDGSSLLVPKQSFYYEDNRFDWIQRTANDVEVHWVGGGVELGDAAIQIVEASQGRLDSYLPSLSQEIAENDLLRLYIYPSSADLRAALRLTGRDWKNNHADPALGAVLVTAVNERTAVADLGRVIPHELAHRRLYQLAGTDYDKMPTWFVEGVATLVETTPNPTNNAVLETAVANQTLLPFSDLCTELPREAKTSILAVAESVSLLKMIQVQYGNQAIRALAVEYAAGEECETAVVHTLNKSFAELEQEWLQTQQKQSPIIQFFADYGIWFLLILFGLLFMGLLIWKL